MKGSLALKTAPTEEPVTTALVKAHMRVDISDDDTLIGTLAKAARRWIENLTGIRMVTQTWNYYLDAFPCENVIKIPIGPVSAVSSVKYTNAAGTVSTLSAASYVVDLVSLPARIVIKDGYAWPAEVLQVVNGVNIEFVAGYGAAAAVPEELALAVKELAAYWYENREAAAGAVGSTDVKELPFSISSLLSDFTMHQRER